MLVGNSVEKTEVIFVDKELIQRFHNAYIKADSHTLNNLWQNCVPNSLIKFFPAKYTDQGINYFLESITTRSLWLSSPRNFNDPFDGSINYDYAREVKEKSENLFSPLLKQCVLKNPVDNALFKRKLAEIYSKYNNEMNETNRRIEKQIFIACFTEKENIYSSRMWGHYANNHCGVCAEYSWENVKNASEFACLPVKYTDTYEYISFPVSNSDGVINFMKFYTKAEEWEYEKEWRVVKKVDYETDGFCVPFELPRKVYLGCRASRKLVADVINICEINNIEVYQMKTKSNSYSLIFEKLIGN